MFIRVVKHYLPVIAVSLKVVEGPAGQAAQWSALRCAKLSEQLYDNSNGTKMFCNYSADLFSEF
jgi:hypothetical protein